MEVINYRTELNKLIPDNAVTCEVGVAEARFSEHILTHWKPLVHVMIDLWECQTNVTGDGNFPKEWHDKNYKETLERVKPFGDKVEIHRGLSWRMSQHVPDESLDLCYIDACHEYSAVVKDIEAYYPKVKKGSIIAFHDSENKDYGVGQAVREFAAKNGLTINLIRENHWSEAGCWIRKPL